MLIRKNKDNLFPTHFCLWYFGVAGVQDDMLINIFGISSCISEKVYICRLIKANRKELVITSVSVCYSQRMVRGNAKKTYK